MKEKRKRRINEFKLVDLREVVLRGEKLRYWFTATSGLSFKRSIIEQILPMPKEFCISSDSFVRFAAIYLSPGILSPDRLAVHRSHGHNLYAFRKDIGVERARLGIRSAYYLRNRFPKTKKFTDNNFAYSLVQLINSTSFKQSLELPESQSYLKSNSTLISQFNLFFRVSLIYIKSQIKQLLKSR